MRNKDKFVIKLLQSMKISMKYLEKIKLSNLCHDKKISNNGNIKFELKILKK